MQKFWVVWNVGNRSPVYKHYSLQEAEKEAERLAISNPGADFVVLQAISACKVSRPLNWIQLTDNDIPF